MKNQNIRKLTLIQYRRQFFMSVDECRGEASSMNDLAYGGDSPVFVCLNTHPYHISPVAYLILTLAPCSRVFLVHDVLFRRSQSPHHDRITERIVAEATVLS